MMKKSLLLVACAFSVFFLTSCANWLTRQECKKVNWYQHGYDAAMGGRRLSGDPMIDKCRAADFDLPEGELDVGFKSGMSNYCKPEIVYTTGKKGDFFNTDMCDPGQANFLKSRHAEGVKDYCSNGYAAGSSGKAYQNICPANLEKAFMPDYKRGRKAFLSARLGNAERDIKDLDERVQSLERDRTNLSFQRNMLPPAREVRERVYNAATGTSIEQSRIDDPSSLRRNQLDNEINGISVRIQDARTSQEALRKQISADRLELATLD